MKKDPLGYSKSASLPIADTELKSQYGADTELKSQYRAEL